MRPRSTVTIALLLLALAGARPAHAAVQLELGVTGGTGYNSNVFGREEDELDDFVWRIGPDIRLLDGDGAVHWELRYQPKYQGFVDFSDLNDWDQDVLGKFDWDVSPRTRLDVSSRYLDISSGSLLSEDVLLPDGTFDTDLAFRVDRLQRLQASAALSHQLSLRNSLLFSLSLFDSDPEDGLPQRSSSVLLSFNHQLSLADSVGVFVRYDRQVVELEQDDTQTNFYNLSLQWQHRFSPTLSFDVSAGPAWVDAQNEDIDVSAMDQPLYPILGDEFGSARNVRASTCPRLSNGTHFLDPSCELFPFVVPSTIGQTTDLALVGELFEPSGNEITYFASVSITKQFVRGSATLRYVRDTDNSASALATRGSVRDAVTAAVRWKPFTRWRFEGLASWQRTEAAGEGLQFVRAVVGETVQGVPDVARAIGIGGLEVDSKSTIDRYTISGRVTYQFNPRAEVYLRASYNRQESKTRSFSREVDRVLVYLGFSYHFTPIPLPI